jgi:hypothetical protein
MPKMNLRSMDRRRGGWIFYVALVVLFFALYSVAIAWSTVNDCDDYQGKSWQLMPPEWECTGQRTVG